MIATWLAGRLSGIIIFCMACVMPVCLVGWVWEGVALHGIAIPAPHGFPFYGPYHLIDGAIHARDLALAARDLAVKDRDGWHRNYDRATQGLNMCNASVSGLAEAGKRLDAAAQALVDQRLREQAQFNRRSAAVDAIKATDAKCPSVDQIFSTGFGP